MEGGGGAEKQSLRTASSSAVLRAGDVPGVLLGPPDRPWERQGRLALDGGCGGRRSGFESSSCGAAGNVSSFESYFADKGLPQHQRRFITKV